MPEITKQLLNDAVTSLDWLVTDAKWRADDIKRNVEEGSEGGYSPELTKAIGVLEELKEKQC